MMKEGSEQTLKRVVEGLLAVLVVSYILYYFFHWSLSFESLVGRLSATGVGLVVLLLGYFTGFLAFTVSLFYLVLGFIVSLPVIASFYAFLLYSVARFQELVFRVVFREVLYRVPYYKRLEERVKGSNTYKQLTLKLDRIFKKSGLDRKSKVKLMEVIECRNCGRETPAQGKYCIHCGREFST